MTRTFSSPLCNTKRVVNGIQEVLNKNILIRNQLLQKDSTMDISPQDIHTWYKKMEMIGIDRKSLDQDVDPGRLKLKTKVMNQHFINELDRIGLQLINITGTFEGKLVVLLEAKMT